MAAKRTQVTGGRRGGRWFRIGPGLILAVAASYFVWRSDAERPRGVNYSPPVRPGQTSMRLPALRQAPEIAFVLEKRAELELQPPQVRALTALDRRWQQETAALREALGRASAAFRAGMEERHGRGEMIRDLEERAAAVSDYSRQLAAARRAGWESAARELTPAQRERAAALWNERLGSRSPAGARPEQSL
jgi:hypothetical protein